MEEDVKWQKKRKRDKLERPSTSASNNFTKSSAKLAQYDMTAQRSLWDMPNQATNTQTLCWGTFSA